MDNVRLSLIGVHLAIDDPAERFHPRKKRLTIWSNPISSHQKPPPIEVVDHSERSTDGGRSLAAKFHNKTEKTDSSELDPYLLGFGFVELNGSKRQTLQSVSKFTVSYLRFKVYQHA